MAPKKAAPKEDAATTALPVHRCVPVEHAYTCCIVVHHKLLA